METMAITPLSDALGAEVVGLDLRRDLDAPTFQYIQDAWHRYQVLVFRGQSLTTGQQKRFAQNFGPLGERGASPTGSGTANMDGDSELLLITNIREDGKPIGALPDGEMFFHSDQCYVEIPYKATLLYGMTVPSRGGETLFANLYTAYEYLPAPLKTLLAGRRAVQVYAYSQTSRPDAFADLSNEKHYAHPVLRAHPATGRTALFVNRLMTVRIEGLSREENAAVMEQLYEVTERPELIYAHRWKVGDLVMWDNRCVNHGRADFNPDEVRLMRRCTVRGERVFAA